MKYIYILLSFISVLSLSSCDLDTTPSNKLDKELVTDHVDDLDKIITGAWVYAMETYSTYANPGYGSFLRAGDAMSSDVVLNTKYGFATHYAFSAIYGKGGTNNFSWTLSYKVIDNMNIVLNYIDEAEGNNDTRNRVKAQAYALRGFMYLHLASHYSFAIDKDPNAVCAPIYTEHTVLSSEPKEASSVSEVYAQAIGDLENALTVIPEAYSRNLKSKIDKKVILGLLARASLYSRDWANAKKYSDDLLAIDKYLMGEEEYKNGFNNIENTEWIWGHPQKLDQNDASYQFHYLDVTSSISSYYSFNADPYFRDLFDDTDYRKSMIYWYTDPGKDPTNESYVWMRYAKFKFKGQDIVADIILMRNSEIYLINAEANARLNNDGEAIAILNELKTARNAKPVSALTGQDLLDAIWIERRKELFGEGFALVDLIRNQQAVVRKEYPQENKVELIYIDNKGVTQKKILTPQGHRILNFPNKTAFVANSKYYLFRIPDVEERNNSKLYNKYPKLEIYN